MKESLHISGRERGRKGSTKGTIRQKKKKKKETVIAAQQTAVKVVLNTIS